MQINKVALAIKSLPDMVVVLFLCTLIGAMFGTVAFLTLTILHFAWILITNLGNLNLTLSDVKISRDHAITVQEMAWLHAFIGSLFGIRGAWQRLMYGVHPLDYIRGRF